MQLLALLWLIIFYVFRVSFYTNRARVTKSSSGGCQLRKHAIEPGLEEKPQTISHPSQNQILLRNRYPVRQRAPSLWIFGFHLSYCESTLLEAPLPDVVGCSERNFY